MALGLRRDKLQALGNLCAELCAVLSMCHNGLALRLDPAAITARCFGEDRRRFVVWRAGRPPVLTIWRRPSFRMGRRYCASAGLLCKMMPVKTPTASAGAPLSGRREATARRGMPARAGGIAPHCQQHERSSLCSMMGSAHRQASCFFFFPGRLQ